MSNLLKEIAKWGNEAKMLKEQEKRRKNQHYQTKSKNYNLQRNYQKTIPKH